MKIFFFEITTEEKNIVATLLPDANVAFFEEKLTDKNVALAKDAEIISIFINSVISKEIIDSLPNLKYISTRSTGFDHIDIAYAKEKGIVVSNVPSYGARTVAEFSFALILDLSRKISQANRQLREDGSFTISNLRGFDLCGKTIGVIGTGKIGKNVIRIARGFDMNVLAYDMFPDENFAKENNTTYLPLADVLTRSDIVSLHTPYTKETHHLINKDSIKLFKKGAYLINTARGEIVDTQALLWGLREGIIAGAGLDVLEDERKMKDGGGSVFDETITNEDLKLLLEDHILIDMPQVIITPHIAFSSVEAEAEILKTSVQNVTAFLTNLPINVVQK